MLLRECMNCRIKSGNNEIVMSLHR